MSEVLIIHKADSNLHQIEEALGSDFHCTTVQDVQEAYSLIKNIHFDGILIQHSFDQKAPSEKPTALSFLEEFKSKKDIPIIVISEHSSTNDQVSAFSLGASDFISCPFNPLELKARVQSKIYLYNKSQSAQNKIQHGPLTLDKDSFTLSLHNFHSKLTHIEFKLLIKLLNNSDRPLSRAHLQRELGLPSDNEQTRKIDAHISNLRRKLGPYSRLIGSVYSRGYVFRSNFL